MPRAEHPRDDLEVIGQDRQAFGRVGEAVAVGAPLVFLPARADAELESAAGDDVEGRDHLRRQACGPVRRGQDEMPEPDPLGRRRDRGQFDERLEDRRIFRRWVDLEVVVGPQRFEAERLSLPGHVHGACPGRRPVQPDVLPVASLRERDADLHAGPAHGP
jgi:hypothetical protein